MQAAGNLEPRMRHPRRRDLQKRRDAAVVVRSWRPPRAAQTTTRTHHAIDLETGPIVGSDIVRPMGSSKVSCRAGRPLVAVTAAADLKKKKKVL